MTTYLYEHPDHPSRVSRPEDADFAVGDPKWVRCYPVEAEVPVVAWEYPACSYLSAREKAANADSEWASYYTDPLVRQSDHLDATAELRAERDAAVAECERLREALEDWRNAARAALTKEQHD